MKNEIRYFSMFTGVGGFELGLEATSSRDGEHHCKEEDIRNTEGNQPIFEGQQESNPPTDNREARDTKDTNRTLFQDGQVKSDTETRDMDEVKGNPESRRQVRQTRDGILREESGVRDDEESVQHREYCTNHPNFRCIGFSEINKYANELLKQRFPNIKNYGDATKIDPRELPDFDMLCGGFPCQAFSIAGKRRGFNDTRGTMFFEISRILEVKRPKIVLLENVKGLLNHEKGKTFTVILQTLEELGYEVQWMVLNSKFFGVPQNRERVFIIASLRGTPRKEILPFRQCDGEVKEIVYVQKSDREIARVYDPKGIAPCLHLKTGGWQEPKISNFSPREFKWRYKSPTLNARDYKDPKVVAENHKIRRLTPLECERLQGFPDGWTEGFSDTQRYKMMGNAVTVNVIKAIGEKIK